MPVIFRCSKCGKILYVFNRVGQDYFGIPTPSEVISLYGGVCPQCGSRLKIPSVNDIKITYLSSSFRYRYPSLEEYSVSNIITRAPETQPSIQGFNIEESITSETSI